MLYFISIVSYEFVKFLPYKYDVAAENNSIMSSKKISKPKSAKTTRLLGAHFSIAKGFHNALYEAEAYGCNAIQMFTKNASNWRERTVSSEEIKLFEQAREATGIQSIASHTSYLINPATYDKKKQAMSYNALQQELIRSSMLHIPYLVLHPGSHMGRGEKEGIFRIAESVNQIFEQTPGLPTRLLFETTAGQGSSVGYTFEHLAAIMDLVEKKNRIGICLDTCHIFAAGYDIRTEESYNHTIDTFDSVIGIKNLYLIHLNDSKKTCGSKVDRHEHIGRGFIGLKAFELFMNDKRFSDIPKIIETPKGEEGENWDKKNLNQLRAISKNRSA